MSPSITTLLVTTLFAGCATELDETSSATQAVGTLAPSGPYADWSFGSDLYNLDARITITADVPASATEFWSTQFGFRNGTGGYMGLQNAGSLPGGGTGKMAIVSIWDATGASPIGGSCQTFEEGGTGYTCRLAYAWVPNHTYRMRAWVVGPSRWVFAVADLATGAEVQLGTITVPSSWGYISKDWVGTWTEYFASNSPGGLLSQCSDLPYASAQFQLRGQGDSAIGQFVSAHVSNADCHNTREVLVGANTVQQIWGGADNSWLAPGQSLSPGQGLWSADGRSVFFNQGDGNLVVYHDGRPLWASRTNSATPGTLWMQEDGNLVLYAPWGAPVWYTATAGRKITSLTMQNDCNLVLYQNGVAVWHTNTWGCRAQL